MAEYFSGQFQRNPDRRIMGVTAAQMASATIEGGSIRLNSVSCLLHVMSESKSSNLRAIITRSIYDDAVLCSQQRV